MESLLPYLIPIMALACPISMGLMMWYMNRSHGQNMGGMNITTPTQPATDKDAQIAVLQEQLQTMQAQIRALETPAPTAKK